MTGVELHNVYALLFNDVVADVTEEVAGHRTVWARSSYLGGQRHSAQWSGDVNATWPGMASTLRGGLSHGLSGVPFWSHDTGGFHGTPEPDLYVRWTQFGALSPLVRLHGTTSRLPWEFPPEARTARGGRAAAALPADAVPLVGGGGQRPHRRPMMRALLVDTPDDPAAWTADLQYRLGSDLLVAPVLDPSGERAVYLPTGDDWLDAYTGQRHTGGRHLRVSVPLDRLPLYVRHGALIPTVAPATTVGTGPFRDVTVVAWGGVGRRERGARPRRRHHDHRRARRRHAARPRGRAAGRAAGERGRHGPAAPGGARRRADPGDAVRAVVPRPGPPGRDRAYLV